MNKNRKSPKPKSKTTEKRAKEPDSTQPSYGGYEKVDWDTCWALKCPDGTVLPMPVSQIDWILEIVNKTRLKE